MAETTIDKVQIEIDATARGASAIFAEMEDKLKKLQAALDGINVSRINQARSALNGGFDMSKMERDIVNSINKIRQNLAGLEAIKRAALGGDSSAVQSFARQAMKIQSEIDKVNEKLRQAGENRLGAHVDVDRLKQYREELLSIQGLLNEAKSQVDNRLTPDTAPTETALDRVKTLTEKLGSAFILIAKGARNAFNNIVSAAKKVHAAVSSMHDKISSFANKGFMRVLKYAFGIRSLYVLFRRLRKAVIESFGELQTSGAFFQTTKANIDALKTALATLKFQFGAAFEPIFNAIAPALQTFINYLITAMNVISAFMAKLMGKSTYSKVESVTLAVAKNTGSAAKNAKELNKQLQKFDELNNLTTNNGGSGGGGGGGADNKDHATYTEATVDSVLGDFGKELAERIRQGDWEGVGKVISDKLCEVMESIPWEKIFKKAKDFGKGLADFLNGLLTPELFADIGTTLANIFNTIFIALGEFAKEFHWEDFGTAVGEGITAWFKTADFAHWGETIHDWIGGILDAGIALIDNTEFEEIGKKIADFLNGLQVGDIASKLGTFALNLAEGIGDALEGLWNNANVKDKIGLAVVGLIAAANLTGLTAKLGAALSAYLLENPILVGQIAIIAATAVITFKTAKVSFGNMAEWSGDKELAESYRNFSWSDFFQTIQKPDGSGIDWGAIKQAWVDMCADYFEPLFEEIDYWKDELKEKFLEFWTSDFNLNLSDLVMEGVFYGPLLPIAEVAKMLGLPTWSDFWKGWFGSDDGGPSGGGGGGGTTNKVSVSVDTKLTGALKKLKDFTDLKSKWDSFKTTFKDVKAKVESTIGGTLTKITDLDTWKEKFTSLKDAWTDKKSEIKTSLTGAFSKIIDVDTLKTKYTNLKDAWADKSAKLKADVGGALAKITDLDTWKTKFSGLKTTWADKTATLKAKVGGKISEITDLDTWKSKFDGLKTKWADKSATLTAKLGGITSIGTLDTWGSTISTLRTNWFGKSATFDLKQTGSVISDLADKIKEIKDAWVSKTATFSLQFSAAASDLKTWVNDNVLSKVRSVFSKVPILRNFTNQLYLAKGGVVDSEIIAHVGESGTEAVIPLENNLKGIRMIASTMLKGMADVGQFRYSASPSSLGFSGSIGSYGSSENAMMAEQNRLLAEQNQLLRQIAAKDVTISSGSVFNAVQSESNSYYNRTGNSPFVF